MKYNLLVVLLVLATSAYGKLPSYIKPCKLRDPKGMTSCVLENLPRILPHFKEGIKELHVPPLLPLHLEEMKFVAGGTLKIRLTNLDFYHFDNFRLEDLQIDPDNYVCKLKLRFPNLYITGDYNFEGKLLMIPLGGSGPANNSVDNFFVDYTFQLKPEKRRGREFLTLIDQKLHFEMDKATMHFEHLIRNDRVLNDQLNNFLNENWKEIEEEIRPVLTDMLTTIIGKLFTDLISSMPMDEIFDMT